MPLHDQPAFIELLRGTRCTDHALLQVALQPLYELLDLTFQRLFGVLPPSDSPKEPRSSVPPGL